MANLTSSLTLSLNDLLSKPAGEAAAALKKFGLSAQDMQKSIKLDSFRQLQQSFAKARAEVAATQQRMKELAAQFEKKPSNNLENALKRAASGAVKAKEAFTQQSRAIIEIKTSLQSLGIPLSQVATEQARLRRGTLAATEALEQQGAKAQTLGGRFRRGIGGMAATALPILGAGIAAATGKAVEAGAELQHAKTSMIARGLPPAEVQAASTLATQQHALYPQLSTAEILELYKEARTISKTSAEAEALLPDLVKAAAAMKALGKSSKGLGFMMQAGEGIGAAKDPEKFTKFLNAGIKAMQVEDNLNPEELFQFLGGLKASGALLSDRFLHSPVMSLAAELGGGKAGSGINQLVKTVVAPSTAQAKEFLALDMMSKSDFKPPTAHGGFGKRFGHIRADKLGELKPDAHVEGWELAQTDPDLWVNKYLLPRLAQHGITDLPGIIDAVIKLVPTNAANIIEKLITQAPEYAAKAEQYRAAHGIESAKDFDKDAVVQASTLGTALTDLGATLTTPAMARAAGILHDISMSLADLQVTLDAWQTNHPAQAEVAASSVIGGGAAALYFGIARPAIRFLKGLMPGGGAIAAGEAAAAPGAGGGLTGWAAGLGIPAAAAYAGTHLTPAEQAIQDEMQRRQSAGEPEPTHGTFNSWDEILRRIKEELPGGGGMGTGYRIPAPTGSPFSPQAPFFQLPSIDTGSSDARAAGARFAEAFREGVFGPLTGAVDDVLKARAAMLAALTFGASPSIKPTGGDIWTSGTTGINANGTFSDMGVAPIR